MFVSNNMGLTSTTLTYLAPKATEFSEQTQNNDHYAVLGHSRSPLLVPMESLYAIFYL